MNDSWQGVKFYLAHFLPVWQISAMTLDEYLRQTGESARAFAKRSGVARPILARIKAGGGCHATTALAIIKATDGQISLEDVCRGRSSTKGGSRANVEA
jgi:hypothetical protein